MNQTKKLKPTTIIIGAGASADFCVRKSQEILAEIVQKPNNEVGQLVKKAKFESENNIAMPTGEALVRKMEGFKYEIPKLFLYKYFEKKLLAEIPDLQHPSNELFLAAKEMLSYLSLDINNRKHSPIFIDEFVNGLFSRSTEYLRDIILRNITHKNDTKGSLISILKSIGIGDKVYLIDLKERVLSEFPQLQKYIDIGKLINFYDPPSIDFFLSSIKEGKIDLTVEGVKSDKDDLLSAGKELIAYYLLKAEDENTFKSENKIWYRWLRNEIIRIGKTKDDIEAGLEKINIISFNYDRSLEAYLKDKMLPEYYEKIKARTIYPYGSLNSFTNIEYGELKRKSALAESGNDESIKWIAELFLENKLAKKVNGKDGIFVIEEEERKSLKNTQDEEKTEYEKRQDKAQKIIEKSKKIYFLGFAFLKENLEFLGLVSRGYQGNLTKVFYTNFADSKKINTIFSDIFLGRDVDDVDIRRYRFHSNKGVYDAIEQDFDLNFN